MPSSKTRAKLTGDTHPPEVEERGRAAARDEADTAPPAGDLARDLADEARPGKGVNQAGFLKDKDGGNDKP